jgi:hypothetical protein
MKFDTEFVTNYRTPPPKCKVSTFCCKFIYNVFMMTDILENVAQCHVCVYVYMYVCALGQLVLFCCAMLLTHNVLCMLCMCQQQFVSRRNIPNLHTFPVSDADLLSLFPECMTFYGIAAATYVFFLRLARCWPRLMVQWSSLEEEQRCYGIPHYLRCKIRCVTAALLFGAAGTTSNHLVLVSQVVSFHDSAFDSWQGQECSSLPIVQPGCGAHAASYLIFTG